MDFHKGFITTFPKKTKEEVEMKILKRIELMEPVRRAGMIFAVVFLFTLIFMTVTDIKKQDNAVNASVNAGATTLEVFLPEHAFTFVKTTESKMPMLVQRVIVKRDDGALFSALAEWNERFYPGEKVLVQELVYQTNLNIPSAWETKMLVATPLNPPPPNP